MKSIFLILIGIAIVFETIADILFRLSYVKDKSLLLWIGVALYTAGTILWAFSLKHEYLSKAVSLFTILNLIAVVAVGYFFFQENVSFSSKIGIGLGIIAVILMQF